MKPSSALLPSLRPCLTTDWQNVSLIKSVQNTCKCIWHASAPYDMQVQTTCKWIRQYCNMKCKCSSTILSLCKSMTLARLPSCRFFSPQGYHLPPLKPSKWALLANNQNLQGRSSLYDQEWQLHCSNLENESGQVFGPAWHRIIRAWYIDIADMT